MRKKSILDIETNAIDFETGTHLSAVTNIHLMVIKDYQTEEIFWYTEDRLQEGLEKLNTYDIAIGHNIIGFDHPVITDRVGKINCEVVDTLIKSRLAHPDKEGGHGLANWGISLGYPKGDFKDFSQFSEEMLAYCIQDVNLTHKVDKYLDSTAYADGKSNQALALEHDVAWIMAEQERYGCCFDIDLAHSLISQFKTRMEEIDSSLREQDKFLKRTIEKEFHLVFKIDGSRRLNIIKAAELYGIDPSLISGPFSTFTLAPIDYSSPNQQKELLEKLGWKPKSFTPTGAPQLDDSVVEAGPIGVLLHERNSLNHKLSKVVGLVEMLGPSGRLHQGANTLGTPTGRMRHKRLVNMPRVTRPFGYEQRSLIKASPGFILIGYDASSLELRELAHYIGSEEYNKLVMSKDKKNDAHTLASTSGGLTNSSEDRDVGKTINYALIFGAGDAKLGSVVGGDIQEGRKLRNTLMSRIPGFKRLTERVAKEAKKGFLYGLDGRKLVLREEHKALNTLIQGGGAVYMKQVMVCLRDLVKVEGLMAFKILDMHDESQWEVLDEPSTISMFKELVEDAFVAANIKLKLRCPQAPEIKQGKNWAETH